MKALTHHGVLATFGPAPLLVPVRSSENCYSRTRALGCSPGALYLGSVVGLSVWRLLARAPRVRLKHAEKGWRAGAVVTGGMLGPLLLMAGLAGMAAADASLLLNAEGVFTALLAWFEFKENFDRRIALGMVATVVAGAAILNWPPRRA